MSKKIIKAQALAQLSPEIMLFIAQFFTVLSIYNIFFNYSENWALTTISISLAFGFINITILFFSLRPFRFSSKLLYKKQENTWLAGAFIIFVIFIFLYLTFALTAIGVRTSHAAAQLIILFGTIFSILLAIGSFFAFKNPGLNRKIKKLIPIRFLIFPIYLLIAAVAWNVAEWNPTLKHYTSEIEIINSNRIDNIRVGDKCYADIGTYSDSMKKNRCRIRFFCNGKKLFGDLGMGMIKGKISNKDNSLYIEADDSSVKDGDPAFSINTEKGLVRFSKTRSLRKGAELTGRILKTSPFFLYYNRNRNF